MGSGVKIMRIGISERGKSEIETGSEIWKQIFGKTE